MKGATSKKTLSLILLIAGIILLAGALIMDFTGMDIEARGAMLILGMIGTLLGMFMYPSLMHHRKIVNIVFLFPLLFTFAVTVIIPLCLGIFYSMTDWNGVRFTEFVGLGNYTTMFKDPAFIWSILVTVLFVIFNMILINVVGFLLALLCTSGMKGTGFFRASYFLPNLIGGIVLGYIWQFVFNNVLTELTGNATSVLA
ncbi:MAG: sugar ABC transporter permease, partial [Ruminococcus sp.]|nr:sugar ABC transporter permease [Ruminococcus sp.]